MNIFVIFSERNFENEEHYSGIDNVFYTLTTAKQFVNDDVNGVFEEEKGNKDSVCCSALHKDGENWIAAVATGNHSYRWVIQPFEMVCLPQLSGEELGQAIESYVNSFNYDPKAVAEKIACSHKTLQQSTMRLFMDIIRRLAQNDTDDRNKATVELAKEIVKISDSHPLPLI